jgi:hypothetical protein
MQRILTFIVGAVAVFDVGRVISRQVATFHPVPWADEWDSLFIFDLAERSPGTGIGLLFFPHNEHRIAIPRLFTLLDLFFAHGSGASTLATIIIAAAATAAVLWWFLRDRVARPTLLTCAIVCLLFSAGQMSNFLWGFQTQVALLYLFAVLAFCFTATAIENDSKARYLAACVFAACGALCQSPGLLLFPAMLIVSIGARLWGRGNWTGPILIATSGAGMTLFYIVGPGWNPASTYTIASLRDLIIFALSFLGSPFAAIAPGMVVPAGAVAAGLAAGLVIFWLKRPPAHTDQTMMAGMCLFLGAIAFTAAITRSYLGLEGATESRFVTPAIMLYAALLIGLWPKIHPSLAMLSATGVAAYSILSHIWLPYDYDPLVQIKLNAEIAYVAGVKDREPLSRVGNLEREWQVRPFVLRHGLQPFASPESRSIGHHLAEFFVVAPGLCRGNLDNDVVSITGDEGGYRLAGWALSDNGRAPPAVLLVQDGIVRGIGRFVQDRPDVLSSVGGAAELRVGFAGYVRNLNEPVHAYAIARGTACRLSGEVRK